MRAHYSLVMIHMLLVCTVLSWMNRWTREMIHTWLTFDSDQKVSEKL